MNRTSTTGTTGRGRVTGDGHRTETPFRLEPRRRRVEASQLVVALLVIAVSALVAVVVFSRASARDPVLALTADIERGHVVGSEDLRVVYVASDDPVAMVPAGAASVMPYSCTMSHPRTSTARLSTAAGIGDPP